jgi:amino acid adenylation domain-containing protein
LCDLVILASKKEEKLIISCEYNAKLFESASIRRMLGHLQTLLLSLIVNLDQCISTLPLLTKSERHQLLVEWNNTQTNFSQDKCIHQLFEEQVERTPNAVALVFEDQQLTYTELNHRSNQLAHYLQQLGLGSEILVGLCVKRSPEMVIGMLGILKAGGAYLPLDPAYPQERFSLIFEDAQVSVLLTQASLVEAMPPHLAKVVCLDTDYQAIVQESQENAVSEVTAHNLAYVIYTSGSTGRPKGVMIEHQSTVAMLDWAKKTFAAEALAGVLASTSICFDLSVFEIFVPLNCAGKVIVVENALHLPTLPTALNVTLINTVPSIIAELLRVEGIPASVHTINIAGEPLQNKLVQQLYQWDNIEQVFNLYGPSEDTTYSTFAWIQKGTSNIPPIGRPIANTQVYILDEYLQPVPIGVAGELYISGYGLARGYLNRPQLTAERFIPNPYSDELGDRLYKTGDLARYLPDGNIEFLGRIDHQVKLRGFRIELGEIEAAISQNPAVQKTAVVVRENVPGRKYLAAYIVLSQQSTTSSELRDFLKQKLPNYMIPGAFVILDALPLSPNGKVDRQALPAISVSDDSDSFIYPFERRRYDLESTKIMDMKKLDPHLSNPPIDTTFQTPLGDSIRSTLRSLVARWLSIDPNEINIFTSFLEMGTDSIILLEAVRSIKNNFGVNVEVSQFFEELTTISDLGTYIEQNLAPQNTKSSPQFDLEPTALSQQPESKPNTLPQQLAQSTAFNSPVAPHKDETVNTQNGKLVPDTSLEGLIPQQIQLMSQQIQLMSQQMELLGNGHFRTKQSLGAETAPSESKSTEFLPQSATVINTYPVCSYNEWDPLEEVIVGTVDRAMIASWHTIYRATVLPGQEKQIDNLSKRTQKQPLPYPEWLVQEATQCLEEFIHILESEGVVVRRPEIVDYSASFCTPAWQVMNGFSAANPRDAFLVIGNEIIEAPMADRGRYFETWAYRSLLKEYFKAGAKWSAAPKPQLLDQLYDPNYKVPGADEEMRFVITEFEPTFDAADFVRFGRDIFVQKSHVTNSLGIEWLQRHLGDTYRIHIIESRCPQAMHIDTTLVPLAPGKVLVNPVNIDVLKLPDYFKSWDILIAPEPDRTPMTLYDTKVISRWVNMNVLSLDEKRVIVEKSQKSMIKALKDWGFQPIPCKFESYYPFLGSFHCATLDIRRRGTLQSYS